MENFATMEGASHSELLNHNYRIRNLVKRPMVLAEKLVDESSDPIYRNGLRCFIKTLTESKPFIFLFFVNNSVLTNIDRESIS